MPDRVQGVRLGVRIHTPFGFVTNGSTFTDDQKWHLAAQGYILDVCAAPQDPKPTAQELEEMAAANRLLRVNSLESGKTQLQQDIDRANREFLAPLKKSHYRDQF